MKSLTGSKVVHHVRESRRQPPTGSHIEHSRSDPDATSDPSQSHISIQQNNINVHTHISHANSLKERSHRRGGPCLLYTSDAADE